MTEKKGKSHPRSVALKPVTAGILGAIGLFAVYYLVLFLVTKDPDHPINQMRLYQPWMSLLILGFGLQVGLLYLLRSGVQLRLSRDENREAKAVTSAGAAFSGASMAACCAHHLTEIIPILGISGTALLLTEYQKELLILGVAVNGLGIIFMIWLLSGREKPSAILAHLFSINKQSV